MSLQRYTYVAPFPRAVRSQRGDDVRAECRLRVGRDQTALLVYTVYRGFSRPRVFLSFNLPYLFFSCRDV